MADTAPRLTRATCHRARGTRRPPAAERLEARTLLSAEMVFDINAAPAPSAPADFAALGNTVYFRANDPSNGYELWKSDGTPAGTTLVKDIVPGGSSPNISNVTASGGKIYFLTNAAVAGSALWATDGTDAGTVKVKDIPDLDAAADTLVDADGTLFFSGYVAGGETKLWKSDGTEPGTVPVKRIPAPPTAEPLRQLTAVGDSVYFTATDDAGLELWKSDGTEAGTARVKDIRPGPDGSFPDELTAVGDTLYFKATTGDFAQGLWKTDGTDAGTVRLYAGSGLAHPGVLENVNGTLYFAPTFGGLWKTDGTVQGTVQVSTLAASAGGNARELTHVNGRLFFPVYDGGGATAWELWTSDGTAAGTTLLTRFANGTPNKNINQLTAAGDRLLFSADDGTGSGNEPWTSDGTPAGTRMLKELMPGAADGVDRFDAGFTPTPGGAVYFRGADPAAGIELWKTDGTAAGTVLVSDINPFTPGSDPRLLAHHDGTMYLTALVPGSNQRSLWKTDGTAAGTAMVKLGHGVPDSNPTHTATIFQGKLFYVGYDRQLWKSDGTEAGTVPVTNFGPVNSAMWRLTPLGDRMFFYRPTGIANGTELWTTDGTAAGTRRFTTLQPTSAEWQVIGGHLYFAAREANGPVELWKTDGTEAGTVRVLAVTPTVPAPGIYGLTNMAGTLYFFNEYQSGWAELWKSDGTAAGTAKVKDGIRIGTRKIYAAAGGILYFAVDDPLVGDEIWRSDGTAAGTGLLKDIYPGESGPFFHNGSRPDNFTESNGKLVFTANDGVSGVELWKSDGTPAGTVRIKDILPGPLTAVGPTFAGKPLVDVNGTVFFVATDTTTPNYELWRTDGTEAGTQRVRDIYPGPDASYPGGFAAFGNTLLFAAFDPVKGRELWRATPWAAVKDRQVLPAGGAGAAGTAGKQALLPGEAATFVNVTPGARGITTIAIDTANLPAGAQLSAADFALSVGNGSSWTPLPAAPIVSVAHGAGTGGTDRITLTLTPGAVNNTWLRVTVKPTPNTELPAPDVFYFGSLTGDAGGAGTPTVNAADVAAVRAHLGSTAPPALARYDFDNSGVVDAADLLVTRNNQRRTLPLFTAPAASSPGPAAPAFGASIPSAPARIPLRLERRSLFRDQLLGLLT